jgi:large subunit ribosomal protein L33
MVRLISMAMTGYYRTLQRPRAHQPLSMLKYDPIGTLPFVLSPATAVSI